METLGQEVHFMCSTPIDLFSKLWKSRTMPLTWLSFRKIRRIRHKWDSIFELYLFMFILHRFSRTFWSALLNMTLQIPAPCLWDRFVERVDIIIYWMLLLRRLEFLICPQWTLTGGCWPWPDLSPKLKRKYSQSERFKCQGCLKVI